MTQTNYSPEFKRMKKSFIRAFQHDISAAIDIEVATKYLEMVYIQGTKDGLIEGRKTLDETLSNLRS